MALAIPTIDDRIVMVNGMVRLDEADACKCCAQSCATEVSITVEFCGMTVEITLPIPGSINGEAEIKPDIDSYLIVGAQIGCTDCGWNLEIGVCGNCFATNQFASDGFTALIPFADVEEAGGGYCPQTGAVDLICFGLQFGFPCKSTATASIA